MSDDVRRQSDHEQPTPKEENYQLDVPRGETIITSDQTPRAASSLVNEFIIPTSVTGTTTSGQHGTIVPFAPSVAPPVAPIETVEYESWMFFETANLALNHWNEYPNVVIRHAIVEDAVLHARSLCEVVLREPRKVKKDHKQKTSKTNPQKGDDLILLRRLIPEYDETLEKFKTLSVARGQLNKEYKGNGRRPTYEKLFNTRVMHPTVLRGGYGLYEEPLRRLQPKILAVVREIARLTRHSFRLPPGDLV